MGTRRVLFLVLALGALALVLGACTAGSATPTPTPTPASGVAETPSQPQVGRIKVVSSVAPITDIVANVGCERIDLVGLIPEGADSHTWEAPVSAVKEISEADLIVVNGLHLEIPMLELAEANKKPGALVLSLGDEVVPPEKWKFDFSFPREKGDPNPHVWPNPVIVMEYVKLVRDRLSEIDPEGAEYYRQNAERYIERLRELDEAMREATQTVPPESRKLLTYHDSWAYWAERYGFTVIGAIQPSDFSEPSPQEVARLIDQIRREKVPAIFGSEVFPSKVLEQIARETGATYVTDLRDDDLPGEAGDRYHSYVGMMIQNLKAMVPALGGDASAMDRVDPSSTCPEG